jgi:uncharacterized protein HemY
MKAQRSFYQASVHFEAAASRYESHSANVPTLYLNYSDAMVWNAKALEAMGRPEDAAKCRELSVRLKV